MSNFGKIFVDGSGPLGLSPDFVLNMATEAGGAVLTALFTAGLVQVANEWRRDVQRDAQRSDIIGRMRRDVETVVELGEHLAKYAPMEIEALKRGELTILPPLKSAPGAINSVQLMVFISQAAGMFAEDLRVIAPLIRFRRRGIFEIIRGENIKHSLVTVLRSQGHDIGNQVEAFIGELTMLERDRVTNMRAKVASQIHASDAAFSEEPELMPDYFKQDVSDLRLYARELVITVWRYNKITDRLREVQKFLAARSIKDNFLSDYSYSEISVDGRVPRQSFNIEVNGEDFFGIYRR